MKQLPLAIGALGSGPEQRFDTFTPGANLAGSGQVEVTITDGSTTETYTGIVTLFSRLAKAKELADRGGHSAGGQNYESRDPMSSQRRGAQKEG